MFQNIDNSNYDAKTPNCFINIFFRSKKYIASAIFLIAVLMFHQSAVSQCPDRIYFRERIMSVYNPQSEKDEHQLKELLNLQQQMKRCHLENDSVFMYLQQKIGLLYYLQSNYDSGIYFTNASILNLKKGIQEKKFFSLALVDNYYNLYYYFNVLKQDENKYKAADSCIAYFLKGNGGYDKVIAVLGSKTQYLFDKGDYSNCSKNAKLGEEIIQKYYHGQDSIQYILFFANKRANALYYSGDNYIAKKILNDKISQFKLRGYDIQTGHFHTLLGIINRDEGNFTEALSFFHEGFKRDSIIKFEDGCAQNLLLIGTVLGENFGKYNEGLKYFSASLKYGNATDSFSVYRETGGLYALQRMYGKAQFFFQKAYDIIQPGMNENTVLLKSFEFPGYNQLQDLSDLITDKGDAFVSQYNYTKNDDFLKKAIIIYKKNDLFLSKVKTEQKLQFASSLVWRSTARSLYEHAIEACYANLNVEDAFYFFEKSRAILLNDQLNEQRWIADADIAKQSVLKKNIIDLDLKLTSTAPSTDEYLKIQKDLYLKNQQLDILTQNIKSQNPLYYQNYLDTAFISLNQLRKNILGNSKSLIEIFSGDSAVYVLVITNNNQSLTKIDKQLYDRLATSFNSFISNPGRLNQDFRGWVSISHQLHDLIFHNINVPDGSIIISPDGINYPFEALATKDQDNPDYILNHYATSYTYSVKYLTNQFVVNSNGSNKILGIAPVRYKSYLHLVPLTGSEHSLDQINSYFSHSTNYVFQKATRKNFLQNFPLYNIIQLYTHASGNSADGDPVIYFSDSALYLSGLLPDRKPITQLVVLSACETANGKLYEGEGVFSFNRGFAALGIPAVISNLWSVENESTYRITELFYKYLSQGLPTDVALQKAKLEFIEKSISKEKKLPYFWAGAILTGKVGIIKSADGFPWLKIGAVMILLLVIAYFLKEKFNQKK